MKKIDKTSTSKNEKDIKKKHDLKSKNTNSIAHSVVAEKVTTEKKSQTKPKLRSLSTIKKKIENSSIKNNSKSNTKNEISKTTRNTRSRSSTSRKSHSIVPSSKSNTQKSPKPNKNKKNIKNNSTIQHDTRSRRSNISKILQVDGVFDDNFNVLQLDGSNDSRSSSKPDLKKLRSSSDKKKNKYKDSSTSEDEFAPSKNAIRPPNLKKLRVNQSVDVKDDIIKIMKNRIKQQKDLNRQKTTKKKPAPDSEGDSDYIPEEIPSKKKDSEDDFVPKTKVKKRAQIKPEDDDRKVKKQGMDVWVEVFLETEEKWISVDVTKGQVHCVKELFVSWATKIHIIALKYF